MPLSWALAIAAMVPVVAGLVEPQQIGACNFTREPGIPHFWDPSCSHNGTSFGCMADGTNLQCRFCGAGAFQEVLCPSSWCRFDSPPHTPYFQDTTCSMGTVGCHADGKNIQCRFCGEFPYNETGPCPTSGITPAYSCKFDVDYVWDEISGTYSRLQRDTPYFWDALCQEGMLGCKADGKHLGCRFCGVGNYAEVHCPASLCTFLGLRSPSSPYKHYWEPDCWNNSAHVLGCFADGIHPQCRYCGGGEYEGIPCPAWSSL